jgi:thiol-disulfide isomerase/thioredoxin
MKLIKRAIALTALFLTSVAPVVSAAQVEDFSFKDLDGQTHQFSEYRGKWVIVNYWATYCGPCVAELPELNRVAQHFKNKAVVLGMEAGETPNEELKDFIEKKKISYQVIPTQDSTMYALGLLYGVPTTFIVSPKGEIIDTHMGAITMAQLQTYINSSLAKERKEDNCDTGIC